MAHKVIITFYTIIKLICHSLLSTKAEQQHLINCSLVNKILFVQLTSVTNSSAVCVTLANFNCDPPSSGVITGLAQA